MTTPVHGPTILLSSGRYFSFSSPTALTPEEVAHALSHLCRFTGHCRQFYSVAQHAVLVSYLAPPEYAYEALHHDDVEAVVGDMASPLKALVPAYKEIEKRCERAILAGFGIDYGNLLTWQNVKHADLVALRTEQRDLMPTKGEVWSDLVGIQPAAMQIAPLPPAEAAAMYLQRHEELEHRRRAAVWAAFLGLDAQGGQ